MKTEKPKRKLKRPSRWQACLNKIRKWLCRPGVLSIIIWAAKLVWSIWRRLFEHDPWSFYFANLGTIHAT